MKVYGIDPGTFKSALVGINEKYEVIERLYEDNRVIEKYLEELEDAEVAIEFMQSYGMAVGRGTFVTVRWIGRFERAFDQGDSEFSDLVYFYARPTVRAHVCSGIVKVKDKDIRAALIMRLGESKKGHPLEGIKKHLWSALAVAVTHMDGSTLGSEDWMRLDAPIEVLKKKKKRGKRS